MATNQRRNVSYGFSDALLAVPPSPIVAQRAPTTRDRAEIGTIWVDQPNDDTYILTTVSADTSTWVNAGGGSGSFTTVTTTGAISAGTTISSVTGLACLAFGFGTLISDGSGTITSPNGTNGQVLLAATGAAPAWAAVTSSGGTLVFTPGANTLNIEVSGATVSSFPTDVGTANPAVGVTTIAGGTNINTSGAASTVTVNLDASPSVAGSLTAGVDLTMTAGDCTITGTTDGAQTIYLHANGGVSETIDIHSDQGTGVASINMHSDLGGVTVTSGLASADAININASDAAGGIDIDYGTGGCSVVGANGAFTLETGTAAIDLGTDAVAKTITMGNITGATSVVIDCGTGALNVGTSATAHTTTVGSTTGASSTVIQSGTGDVVVTSTDDITVDSAGVLELNSSAGIIGIGNDADAFAINVGTGAAARTVTIGNITGATAIDIDAGTGGINLTSTGTGDITLDSDDTLLLDADGVLELNSSGGAIGIGGDADAFAINIGVGAAQRDVTIGNITGTTGVDVNAGSGDINLTSTDSIIALISGTGAINVGADAAAKVITVGNVTAATSVVVDCGTGGASLGASATAHTTTVGSTNTTSDTVVQSGTGGISLEAAGIVDVVPATDSQAAATVTINANVGVGTFTGITTAAAASQVFTITNSVCTTSSAILCTLANKGANDAQMQVMRVIPLAGSFTVTAKNGGAAALNGDVIITFWILKA